MKKFTKKDLIKKLGMSDERAKLVMKAQNEFPELLTSEGKGYCIDGRKLFIQFKLNKTKTKFADWIKNNLEITGMENSIDYSVRFKTNADFTQEDIIKMSPQKRSSYGITEEYDLTLECAKEIAMITGATPRMNKETKELSKIVRKYFIYLEEAIKDMNNWVIIREPEKQGHKVMCSIIDKQYQKAHEGEKPNFYIYTNNSDMLNLSLFGYKSKQMKTILDVEYDEPLRDNLTSEANKCLYELQQLNSNLLLSNLDFKTRKMIIENTCKERYMDIRIKIISEFSEEIKQFK